MRPVAVYSALRLGLFLAALLVLRLVGVSGLLSVVVALLVSMLLSFVLLRRQRDDVTRALMDRRAARSGTAPDQPARSRAPRRSLSARLAEDAAVEDAAVSGEPSPPSSSGGATATDDAAGQPGRRGGADR